MELRVVGCHGGETPKHRTSAFLLDERLALDGGSLTAGLDLKLQAALEACVVSHAHLDHVRDLATIADNRCQLGCEPLLIAGTRATLDVLRKHFFNGLLWPDFTKIPTPEHPTIRFLELKPERPTLVAGYRVSAIPVSHSIESCGFVVEHGDSAIAYSGDTGPTERFWEVLRAQPRLNALLIEVSFPNRLQALSTASGHHTPQTLEADLRKYGKPQDLPTLLFHMKPAFQGEVEQECARLQGLNLTVLNLRDQFVL